jgi:outer membrane protein OmpA-like peptidoglycan-associated protein
VPSLALELEREPGAAPPLPEPERLPDPAPVIPFPSQLASLPTPQRARALAGMQRGDGNAAVARILSTAPPALARAGERCKCGGTIGPDGQCDKCRAMRAAGLDPEADSETAPAGDAAIARMLAGTVLQRQGRDDEAEAAVDAPCQGAACNIPSDCEPPFCCPYPTGTAYIIRETIRNSFLLAIGGKVTPSVVPVWLMWFNGGVGMQHFTGRFGADFAADTTTGYVSSLLAADVAASLDATQLATLAGSAAPGASVSLLPALPASYATTQTTALETEGGPLEMNFGGIGTAPGNLAGGVGKTQTACPVGATPGAVDDARILTDVKAILFRNPNGSITVTPTLHYKVIDTVDLCPGNCGSDLGMINEQLATYPMSRLEASGVSGDVPFTVEFTNTQPAFVVPPPAPPVPVHVIVSATTLFDYASADLSPGGEEAIVNELGDRPAHADLTQAFTVEGHTDSKGSDATNQPLSERRATTVVELLERRYPNLVGHLTPIGYGETRPIAPNDINGVDNPDGRAQNRRVEMRFAAPPPTP